MIAGLVFSIDDCGHFAHADLVGVTIFDRPSDVAVA
jgi:hypothetical protein